MKKIFVVGLCLFLFFGHSLHAEEGEKDHRPLFGLSIGTGIFKAHGYHANNYNGNEDNRNKISYVLGNRYWYNMIKQELGNRDFSLVELPTAMRYKISTPVGLKLSFNLGKSGAVFFQFQQLNLTAADVFSVEVDSNTFTSEPALKLCNIWGKESRTMLDLGYRHFWEVKQRIHLFAEFGFNLTNTKIKENSIQVGNFTESIIDRGEYVPGQQMYDMVEQSYIGIGVFAGAGVEVVLSRNFSLDLGVAGYLQEINFDNYPKFKPNFSLFFRINLQTL